ncbi:MAG: hypothetical protein AAGG11_07015 [Pseudomonadota bacterium]
MTARSAWQHQTAELKARVMTRLASYLFSRRDTAMTRLVKKLLKADRAAEYSDPELEHPPQE